MNTNLTKKTAALLFAGILTAAAAVAQGPVLRPSWPLPPKHDVDLAICLDTSGSMDGLIESAKQKLWAIVNDLALAEPTPRIRVALLTYGNNGHDAEKGWVFVQTGLTDDLDLVSEKLFALSTNGGTELVGRVMQASIDELEWSPNPKALKLIVVAGNESADQDQQVSFRDMSRKAIANGIMVNSIYCGNPADNLAPGWQEISRLADGQFASIDKDHGTVVIETPFDEQLHALSVSLNETYVPFGASGAVGGANQAAQDLNAQGLNGAAAASRAWSKSNGLYVCGWDLIDNCRNGQLKLSEVKVEDLPENMQKMTPEDRQKYVDGLWSQRTKIQAEVGKLYAQREAFVTEEMKKLAVDAEQSFDFAVRKAVREQAASKGMKFKELPKPPAKPEAAEAPAEPAPAGPAANPAQSGTKGQP